MNRKEGRSLINSKVEFVEFSIRIKLIFVFYITETLTFDYLNSRSHENDSLLQSFNNFSSLFYYYLLPAVDESITHHCDIWYSRNIGQTAYHDVFLKFRGFDKQINNIEKNK